MPRASGKSTLVSAFVDLINRQRNDYVITLEGQIRLVHESRGSLISQRELRGSASEVVTAARAALRENPDVLVIEDLRSPDVLQVALDAAGAHAAAGAAARPPRAVARERQHHGGQGIRRVRFAFDGVEFRGEARQHRVRVERAVARRLVRV